MGKQIRFIMDEYDESIFFAHFINSSIVFWEKSNENPKIITKLPEKWLQLYLYKECFGEIVYTELENGFKFINPIIEPVIQFRKTIVRTNVKEITRGRLWLEMKYYDDDGNLLRKSDLLDDWYKELSKWIKRNLTRIKKDKNIEYVSKSLIDAVENGYKLLG